MWILLIWYIKAFKKCKNSWNAKFIAFKRVKMADFALQESSKLISRKICIIEKVWDLLSVSWQHWNWQFLQTVTLNPICCINVEDLFKKLHFLAFFSRLLPTTFNTLASTKTYFIILVIKTVATLSCQRLLERTPGRSTLVIPSRKLWTNLHYATEWNPYTKQWRTLFSF